MTQALAAAAARPIQSTGNAARAGSAAAHTDRVAHALALAEASHLLGTARLIERDDALQAEWFTVTSRDRTMAHIVTHDLTNGAYACTCVAGSYGRACCHVGAALHYDAQRAQAMSPAGVRAQRGYEQFCETYDR